MPYVGAPKDFDRIAKEFHVDYAFHKVGPEGTISCFSRRDRRTPSRRHFPEYTKRVMARQSEKPSILGAGSGRLTELSQAPAEGKRRKDQRGGAGGR